jgi:hypothetical protein
MQMPTHIVAGVILRRAFAPTKSRALSLALTAVLAFLSHGLLDKLARITYHRPTADLHSAFWVGYHLLLLLATIAFFYFWWKECKWGIIFAILPDLDWVFIHAQEWFHLKFAFYQRPHMHDLLQVVFQRAPFSYLDRLPNNRYRPWACLWELALIAALLWVSRMLKRKPQQAGGEMMPQNDDAKFADRNI